jgi:hypothetical protein
MGTIASLSIIDLAVEPGAQAATTIRVRNTGSIVDRFDIDVVGPAAAWARVEPPSLSLFPGAEGTATIAFVPARASTPRAGTFPYGVRVRPAADPRGSTVEEGHVTVAPFTVATAEIAPQTSRGSRRGHHEVVVANRGNAPVEVVVAAVDPDRRLRLAVEPQRAVVVPEAQATFGVDVRVDDPFPFGPNRPRPFLVSVEPGRQAPIQLRATLNQRAILPGWLPPLGGLALAAAVLGVAAFAFGAGPFAPAATPSPQAQVDVTPSPSVPPPTASPSVEVPSQVETTPSPSPKPLTLGDFTLKVTGDDLQLGNGLTLRCAPNDAACRDAAKETVRTLVTELQNPYSGAGIVSTRILGTANTLPVVLAAGRDFPWRQLGAGEQGATETAVIDLGPLLASPPGYVYAVVDTADGQETRRFVVDAAFAKQLFDLLYQLPPEMGPVVAATPSVGSIRDQVFVDSINWNVLWVLSSPTP